MKKLFRAEGLYGSLYGKPGSGGYHELYKSEGSPTTQRMDIRLGGLGLGQEEEDDDDDDDDAPEIITPEIITPESAAPLAKPNFFSQENMGFPNWLIGVFLLGFALAYRQRKKAEAA